MAKTIAPGSDRAARHQGGRDLQEYSDEEILEGLRWAARLVGEHLSSGKYNELTDFHPWLASLPLVYDRFDTWNNALESAELPTRPARRQHYQRIDDDECISAIRRVARALGHYPSIGEYNDYRDEHAGRTASGKVVSLPSSELIRRRLRHKGKGGWLNALKRAEAHDER